MSDFARRFENNPLLTPKDIRPSLEGFIVGGVFNPGAFQYNGKTGLLLRVAEFPPPSEGYIKAPVLNSNNSIDILSFPINDPKLKSTDPRIFSYNGKNYLTSISHLRLAWSDDGKHFKAEQEPAIRGISPYESYGVEDCRITQIDDAYYLTYSAVSENGVCTALITTTDWKQFHRRGIIFLPQNKDCAIFPEKINGYYYALNRPTGVDMGGHYIWISRSKDLIHWGDHKCIAQTRQGEWDSVRIGAGASPIKTPKGWLEIYHGADEQNRYCLGTLLLDIENPSIVLARSEKPVMEPLMKYEQEGFFGNVVFTNGHIVNDEIITIYYGAADQFVCGADFLVSDLL